MDHIFGDSHDIAFGDEKTNNSLPKIQKNQNQSNTPTRVGDSKKTTIHRQDIHQSKTQDDIIPSIPLNRLVSGMKPSFLPREDNTHMLRIVALSSPQTQNPLFLMRQDDTTILVGSGFDTLGRAGKAYPSFPDMRLIFSEKERIHAWILTDDTLDVTRFEHILPTLGFPPIYATREIIALFRKNIHNTSFLDSCRFFELFADGSNSRRIGDIEYSSMNVSANVLGIRSGGTSIALTPFPIASSDTSTSPQLVISRGEENMYQIGSEKFGSGEIMMIQNGTINRHSMRFTFDTFFVDGGSIGVEAGYALTDREQLAENGVLLFTLEEDRHMRSISGHIFIDSRGFVHSYEMMSVHKEILKGIRATYEKLLLENPKIERGELVQGLRREITKYCYVLTGRTPVVMPIVIER